MPSITSFLSLQPRAKHQRRGPGHDRGASPTETAEQPGVGVLAHDLFVASQQQHQNNERWSKKAVYDSGPEEHFDGIQPGEVESQSDYHRNRDNGVKLPGKDRLLFERAWPVRG